MSRKFFTGIFFALLSTAVVAQDAKQQQHPWARWQVGATVEIKTTNPDGSSIFSTQTLSENKAKSYSLETKLGAAADNTGKAKLVKANKGKTQSFPRALNGFAHTTADAKPISEASMQVGEQKFSCTVFKSYWTAKGTKVEESTWIAKGQKLPLKIVSKSGNTWRRLQAKALSETLTVNGQKISCVKYQGHQSIAGVVNKVTTYMSLEVPGGVVKSVVTTKAGEQTTTDVIKFSGKLSQ